MFHILYDGTVVDEQDYAAIGGDAETIRTRLGETWADGLELDTAIRTGIAAIAGPDREIPAGDLEVAKLARGNGRRCFERVDGSEL